MVVLPHVVVVEVDQGLDGLLHRTQLDQGHLPVFPDTQNIPSHISSEPYKSIYTTQGNYTD